MALPSSVRGRRQRSGRVVILASFGLTRARQSSGCRFRSSTNSGRESSDTSCLLAGTHDVSHCAKASSSRAAGNRRELHRLLGGVANRGTPRGWGLTDGLPHSSFLSEPSQEEAGFRSFQPAACFTPKRMEIVIEDVPRFGAARRGTLCFRRASWIASPNGLSASPQSGCCL